MLAYYRSLFERTEAAEGSIEVDMHDLLASDDHVVALSRRTFAGVDARAVAIYHLHDGKTEEVWVHEAAQVEVDKAPNEAWSE